MRWSCRSRCQGTGWSGVMHKSTRRLLNSTIPHAGLLKALMSIRGTLDHHCNGGPMRLSPISQPESECQGLENGRPC